MNQKTLTQDLLASIVVFLVALPLCMGIAIASGAPPITGLITGIVGGIVVGSISGCQLQVAGPAAGLAVLVYEIVDKHGLGNLAIVIVIAGLLQITAGLLRAGQLFRAISPAVIFGMLAGIGILIFGAQFHVMVDDQPRESGWRNLISIPEAIYKGLWPVDGNTHHLAAFIGVGTILLIIGWSRFAPTRLKWIPGALVGVLGGTAAAWVLSLPIRYVQLPQNIFDSLTLLNPATVIGGLNADLILLAVTVAFVASAETLLSAAAVDQMHDGPRTKYNRELFAQGIGNTICGFLGGLPMTGVIVRSATNVAAGARTRRSAIFHGVWLLVLVSAAPSLLALIPTASLAAVLVFTGYKLVNVQNVRRLLRYGGAPVVIYAVTVIGIVGVDLLTGILAGLVLSVLKVIYARTHFHVRLEQRNPARLDIHLEGAGTFFRMPKLADSLETIPCACEVHVHFRRLDYIDDACLEVLSNWQRKRGEKGQIVVLEWSEALRLYRDRNPLGSMQRAEIEVSAATH